LTIDRRSSIILLVFSGFWAYQTYYLPGTTLEGTPGPRFFPSLLVIILSFLSVLLFIRGGKRGSANEDSPNDQDEKEEPFFKGFIVFIAILFYVILVKYIGFMMGTIIGLTVVLSLNPERNWKTTLITACLTGIGLHVIFKVLLKIPLPTGILF